MKIKRKVTVTFSLSKKEMRMLYQCLTYVINTGVGSKEQMEFADMFLESISDTEKHLPEIPD